MIDFIVKWLKKRLKEMVMKTFRYLDPNFTMISTSGMQSIWVAHEADMSSGNRAFDKYRNDTLKRLEEERRKLDDFRERLAAAKDQAEFDQFMEEIRPKP